jgi:hypothetical protein
MASATEHDIVPNTSNNMRNSSEEEKRDTLGANGVTGEEREVTRRGQDGDEEVTARQLQAEAEDERVEAETSVIFTTRGRGRPRKEKSNMIMQLGEEEDEPKAVGMASISKKRGRRRKDKTNIIMSTIEEEASEEDLEGIMNGYTTRKSRWRAKKRISRQLLEEESVSGSNEEGDYDDDFGPPAKKRGRRGPKPRPRSTAMVSPSANGGSPFMIPPILVEEKKRRVTKTPAAEVEREIPEGIFDEF